MASPAPPTLFCGARMIPSSGPAYVIRVHVALGQWEGPSPAIPLETKHQCPEKVLVAFYKDPETQMLLSELGPGLTAWLSASPCRVSTPFTWSVL